MANNRFVYQQQTNVSIPRKGLLYLAEAPDLKQNDYRVLLALFSTLDGWDDTASTRRSKTEDPLNFRIVKASQIGDLTGLSKKEVKFSISRLLQHGIIERGSNDTIKDGYRFTF